MSVFNNLIRYLPPFIANTGKKANGTIELITAIAGATFDMNGTDTKFTQDFKVDDVLIFWGVDSPNNMLKASINSITSDILAIITVVSASTAEIGVNTAIVANPITQTLLIAIDNQITYLINQIESEFRFGNVARRQLAKEFGIHIGKWEDVTQLDALLADMTNIHKRRGTEGTNMTSLSNIGYGILGECDRISKNPNTGVGTGTEIASDDELVWTLAGDIEYVFDGVTGIATTDPTSTANLTWRYPDFTIPIVSAPRGTYSPGNLAVCWVDTIDMYIIIIENKNETNYSNRQIEKIIEKIVPIGIPYIVQFI